MTGRLNTARKAASRTISCLCVLLTAFMAHGCGSSDNGTGGTNATRHREATPVVCRLKWLFNASVAGEIWALEAGLFEAQGLQVTLREGGAEQDAITDLEMGRAQFGIASADQIIRASAKGAKVVVIAQVFQQNPLQWIYRGDQLTISSPAELKGRTVGITYGGNDEAIFMALLKKYAISPDALNLYAVHYDYNPFWQGKVDLWPVYRNVEGIVLARKMARMGDKASFFDPDAFGIRFVANSVITSREMWEKHRSVVLRFRKAVLAGWQEALEPGREKLVAETIRKYDTDTPEDVIRQQLAATRAMVLPKDGQPVGSFDVEAWRQTEAIMLSEGLIDTPVDVTRLLAKPLP